VSLPSPSPQLSFVCQLLDDGTSTGSWGFPFCVPPLPISHGPQLGSSRCAHGYAGTAVHITMPCAGLWKRRRVYPLGTQTTIRNIFEESINCCTAKLGDTEVNSLQFIQSMSLGPFFHAASKTHSPRNHLYVHHGYLACAPISSLAMLL
jgi:hypothetical protein